jgi:hypothetical protein
LHGGNFPGWEKNSLSPGSGSKFSQDPDPLSYATAII